MKNNIWRIISLVLSVVLLLVILVTSVSFEVVAKVSLMVIAAFEIIHFYNTPNYKKMKGLIFRRKGELLETDKPIVACHEAGHALIGRLVADNIVEEISIIPNDKCYGFIKSRFKSYPCNKTKERIIQEIRVGLGGLAAEEVVYGFHRDGVELDLEHVKVIAEHLLDSGLGKELIYFNNAEKVNEIRKIINEAKKEDIELLKKKKDILVGFQNLIVEKGKLTQPEIESFFLKNNII